GVDTRGVLRIPGLGIQFERGSADVEEPVSARPDTLARRSPGDGWRIGADYRRGAVPLRCVAGRSPAARQHRVADGEASVDHPDWAARAGRTVERAIDAATQAARRPPLYALPARRRRGVGLYRHADPGGGRR